MAQSKAERPAGPSQNQVALRRKPPLSPMLANVLLDDLDKELEKRGHRFCRYAEGCNIDAHNTKVAWERVMASVTRFLEEKLKLRVNREKDGGDWRARPPCTWQ
jgi:retron-type reverse transcriptase